MNNWYIVLTPILTFLVVLLVGFVGCGDYLPPDADAEPDPEPDPGTKPKKPFDPAGPVGPPYDANLPKAPPTYEDLVTGTNGFAAFWPLNEMSGNTVSVVGSLNPAANGEFKTASGAAPGIGAYALGKLGVLYAKDPKDFAVELQGTESFIEVPFVPQLNPSPMAPFSVELWVKPDQATDRGGLVSSHHFDSVMSQQGYEIALLRVMGQDHHQVYARVYGGAAQTISEITVQPVSGDKSEWRHIVFTYEFVAGSGYVIRLRVQVLKDPQVYTQQSTTPVLYEQVTSAKQSTLRFGGTHLSPQGSALLAGQLDNIAFYNAALSDADILAHYGMA